MSKSTPKTTWPNKEALLSQEQHSLLSERLASEIENLLTQEKIENDLYLQLANIKQVVREISYLTFDIFFIFER